MDKKLEEILKEGIRIAKIANGEFGSIESVDDWDEKDSLSADANCDMNYAKGIQFTLQTIGFNHPDMKMLDSEIASFGK